MSTRTIAEICYTVTSGAVTWFVVWGAAWGYPQGRQVIWPVGLVALAFVIGMGIKPIVDSWRADRAAGRSKT
jgi:hypothetical protein